MKVCLVGDKDAGKTALVRRYVQEMFDDRYITTLGTRVSKKRVRVVLPERDLLVDVDMHIWDIFGAKGFQDLFKEAFFYGAKGILAVCDVTRKQTLVDLNGWIRGVFDVVGEISVVIAVNDTGKGGPPEMHERDAQQMAQGYDAPIYFTSAKTGENVQEAFQALAERMVVKEFTR